jgi:hypothetical protein
VISLEEESEGTVQDCQLLVPLSRLAKGVPERKTHEQPTRRRGLLGYLKDDG